jgi:hypothetical protein
VETAGAAAACEAVAGGGLDADGAAEAESDAGSPAGGSPVGAGAPAETVELGLADVPAEDAWFEVSQPTSSAARANDQ